MKNKNALYIILFVLLMVLLFVPILQQVFHPIEVKELKGATVKTEKPELSFEGYKTTAYQAQLEKYLSENFGFREPVIRCYNQYLWSCFRKTYAFDVVIGKDKWLYGKKSVFDHYRQVAYEYADSNEALVQKFEKDLSRLKRVQQLLDERGTKLFVLICPSKDIIYPEHLPVNGNYVMSDGLRAIEYYPQAFAENGINYVDMCAWFQQIKDTVSYPLFGMTGMHWSDIACVHAVDSILHYMEHLTGKNLPNYTIGPKYERESYYPDNDLEKTMNLMFDIQPNWNSYVDVKMIPDSTAERCDLVAIGDSFFWNWCYTLPMDKIFNTYRYWYYYKSVLYDPNHTHVSQLNLMDELDRADIVMISLSATQLYEINHGFLSQALVLLSAKNPSNLDDILVDIKRKMESNETWYQGLKDKAAQHGKTLEQVMDEDARYVFNQDPEKYVMDHALNGIKEAMRNDSVWYQALMEKAVKSGKDIEQVIDEDALYILNQDPEKFLN